MTGVVQKLSKLPMLRGTGCSTCLAVTTCNTQLSSAIVTCYKEKTAHKLFPEMRSEQWGSGGK